MYIGASSEVALFPQMMLLGLASTTANAAKATGMNFTIYSQPIELRYGEVYNKMQSSGPYSDHTFPEDVIARYADGTKIMAIKGFTVDMVRKTADGKETPVKLNDHYLHHYILYFGGYTDMQMLADVVKKDKLAEHMLTSCHGMNGMGLRMLKSRTEGFEGVGFGSAAGAEYRHNPQEFQAPFRLLIKKPQAWFPTFHVINSNKDNHTVSPLLACPCTPQRKIDPKAGTIDGRKPSPVFGCSPAFAKTGNPSCNLSTYVGGWRCCEHGMFLIDTDKECRLPNCADEVRDKIFMKFTFEYEDATEETRDIEGAACCDTTSNHQGDGNIEHDVPACPAGTPPDQCIFVTESVQPIAYYGQGKSAGKHDNLPNSFGDHHGSDLVDLVSAAPHLHYAGISIELIDHETNETICEVHRTRDNSGGVMYGTGEESGNEKDYLVGLRPCTWGGQSPKRFRRDHLLRSRSVYNASTYQTGVMSLWLSQLSPFASTRKDQVLV
jgi:hypothetical protein